MNDIFHSYSDRGSYRGYYGKQIVVSASPFSGRLSGKIREWIDSRKVKLKHNNIYKNGIHGIFEDLETKIDFPEELYLANQFSAVFLEDETITNIYSFFYGKDNKGKRRSFLLDYDSYKSDKMTVLDHDGNILPLDVVKSEKGIYNGYEISVYTSDKELVARYMDGSRRIAP